MPKHEQPIFIQNFDKERSLAICYLALQQLNWDILFAGENNVLGRTAGKKKGQQIFCSAENGQLTVSSEMVNGEIADFTGRNKKNTTAFIDAFESVNVTADDAAIEKATGALNTLREVSIRMIAQEQQEAREIDNAMNLSGSNLYVTYSIIAINVLVFILMVANGAGIFDANGFVHIKWGSNYLPLTLSGDWWRLLTNVFIHFGIIHIAMNMYCLYTVGVYLEPMLGKLRYTTAYLCTGVLASLTSLWWHKEGVNSAGASGAIFGVYGLFLALLTSSLIPQRVKQALGQSIVVFVIYNLLYGMKSGVDNSAHIGGLVSGFFIGYGYVYGIKKEKTQEQKMQWMVPAIILLTIAAAFFYLEQNKVPAEKRMAILNQVRDAAYTGNDKFYEQLDAFDKIHQEVNSFLSDTALTYEQLDKKIDEIGFPKWQAAEQLIASTKSYDISQESHNKAEKLLQFIELKKKELELLKQICQARNDSELVPQLNDIRTKANTFFEELVKQ